MKPARTKENMIAFDEMEGLLNHKGQKKHIVQYVRYPKTQI